MSSGEIKKLASDEVQEYIFTHANEDEKKLVLKHRTILGLPASLIAQQISARRKAATKLPLFHKTSGIIYPPALNLEQSSSEATAKFKSEIIQKEIGEPRKAVDLTGGFGVDSFFLSQISNSLDYIEPNSDLLNIVRHNHSLFTDKIHHQLNTAEEFLMGSSTYDFVFIDPSRRDAKTRKVFSLSDCTPDVTRLLSLIFDKTRFILLKASPLLDLKQGLKELKGAKKVIVVSVENECKEVLFRIQKDFAGEPAIETYNLNTEGKVRHSFDFKFSEEAIAGSKFNAPQKYLYEPNASLLKAGAFKTIGLHYGLDKIQTNTHLYTSDDLKKDFPGRIFEIESLIYDSNALPENKANIITRNYPLTPDELKKKLKLRDGGEKFVIAFSGQEKKYLVLSKRVV